MEMEKMIIDEQKSVKKVFDNVWTDIGNSTYKSGLLYKIYNTVFGRFNSARIMFRIIKNELQIPYYNNIILEPGCGGGQVSELLSRKLQLQQDLLDISPKAIEICQSRYIQDTPYGKTNFIIGSMFDILETDKKYSLVWNEGVLEHFSKEKQVQALNEFARVLKDNGKIIVIIPNKKSLPYLLGMSKGKKQSTWEFGYEQPETTLQHIVDKCDNLELEREYSRGFISQLGFYRYYFMKNKFLFFLFQLIFSMINLIFFPLNILPGYYLISVIKKKCEK